MSAVAQPVSAFHFLLEDAPRDSGLGAALREAYRGVGRTAPNPPVGAVLEQNGDIVGRGFHAVAGTPHAEPRAIDDAGARAAGATAYVTLEPCAHHGKTPPCTDALINAKVARCIVGAQDPFELVDGRGLEKLRAAGIDVQLTSDPALAARAQSLIAPFRAAVVEHRPYVIAKVAASLDGRVATATGQSKWVTGKASRALVHALRDRVDAVLVGGGTALADDPSLTVRDAPMTEPPRQPRRVLLDRTLRVPLERRMWSSHTSDAAPNVVLCHTAADPKREERHAAAGRAVLRSDPERGLSGLLGALPGVGIHSVLIEPGPRLMAALLAVGVVDEIWWFSAPVLVGQDGQGADATTGRREMSAARRLGRAGHLCAIGDDVLSVFFPRGVR